jgi:hypothetical protein
MENLVKGVIMSDDQARIQIICSRSLRREVKRSIASKNVEKVNDGYLKIIELGLKEFNKMEAMDD